MSLSSPWSQEVVRRLSSLGVVAHLVEFQPRQRERGYIEYGRRDIDQDSDLALAHAAAIHRIETPRKLLGRFASGARSLRRIAKECNADAVLTLYGGSLAATTYLSGIRPYVVYVVGSDVLLATALQKLIARVALTASAAVLANGEHLARSVSELAPNAKVMPLYLGVDLADYQPIPTGIRNLTFVCTRGFLDVYDNATIVRALGVLGALPTELTVSFVSSGPLLRETERLADRQIHPASRERIVFLGGVSHEDLKRLLNSASFYLSASLSDGTSSSLLEAMATGLFPIVSDIPANREWITHASNGLLFSPGDHRALAEQIQRALRTEPWMAEAVAGNRKLVEQRANAKVTTGKLLALLKQCLQ